jgi:malonyl-CoA/methylmalonyl-CoA synthetase
MEGGRVPLAPEGVAAAPTVMATGDPPGLRPWTDHRPPGDLRGADVLATEGTLVHAFLRRWAGAPDDPLWLDPTDGRWWSNARFEEATRRAAGGLLGAGLEPGDRVLCSSAPSIESLVANVACLRAGLVVVPANVAYAEPEVASVIACTDPRGAIVDNEEWATWVRRSAAGPIVVTGPAIDLPRASGPVGPIDQARPDDPALIGMTSGTTGVPKGAVLRQRHLLAGTEALRWAWRWTPEDRLVHCLPLFHSHGLCVGAYGTMVAGASAVILGRFDPGEVADTARRQRASLFFGVPTMYHRLVGSGALSGLRGLRLCVSGSAPLPAVLHAEASAALGAPLLERYGMTETMMLTSNPYDGDRRAGTVGFPLPGVEVRRDGHEEVLVRGPNVFDGYIGQPVATTAAFVEAEDGGPRWFRTGDLGAVRDGSLVIRGRSKELIISGGYNIHPGEVEEALARCPGVAEVAITGTPSEEWGEVVTAWVVADGRPPTLDELCGFASGSLAPYKRPRLLRVVDGLPRNAMGKLVRSRLGGEASGRAGA